MTDAGKNNDDLNKAVVPKLTGNNDEVAKTTVESTEPTHDDDDLKKPSATKTSGKDNDAAKTTVESTAVTNDNSGTKMSAQKYTKEAEMRKVSKGATAEASAVSSGLVLPKKRDILADPPVNFGFMQNVFLSALQEGKKQKKNTMKPHFTIHLASLPWSNSRNIWEEK